MRGKETRMTGTVVRAAFHRSIPIMAGYVILGMGFGILTEHNGFSPVWAFLMSLIVYSGSMQFVGVSLLTGGASILMTAMTSFMVGARHMFYSLSMVDKYRSAGKKKFYLFYALTDETYSVVCGDSCPDGEDPNTFRFLVSFFDQIYWLVGSVAGALAGEIVPFSTEGVGFAMTALFITIFVDQWMKTKQHVPAIMGLAVTAVCRLVFGPDVFLIPAMTVLLVTLTAMRSKFEAEEEKGGDVDARD